MGNSYLKINNRKTGLYSKQNARFMLKSFARYWVEIVDVKLERLLDITAEAAIAEGIEYDDYWDRYWDYMAEDYSFKSQRSRCCMARRSLIQILGYGFINLNL